MKIFFGFGRGATGTIVSLAQQVEEIAKGRGATGTIISLAQQVEEIAKEMAQVTRFLAIAA